MVAAAAPKRRRRSAREVRAIGAAAHRLRVSLRTADVAEHDGYARQRFRGQGRRGGLAVGAAAAQLVYSAIVELGEAHRMLLRSNELPEWPRRERDEVRAEAWRRVSLAERLLVAARAGRQAEQ